VRDLLIAGDGVHGAEMAEIVERINRAAPTWNLLGYLSADESKVGAARNGYPVLGSWETLDTFPHAALVPDNEWPRSLPLPHDRLVSLIDPSVFVSRTARVGVGCVFYPHGYLGLSARIGDHVFALAGCTVNHDDVLEDRVVLASGVTLAGSVHVEEGCYLGQSCSVRQMLRIGRDSVIGMGAVVIRDVPPGSVIVGNPGRLLRSKET
jgi:sugar O-acyltransferase (sialic acid O-acetyltransferase NeuD family)